MRFSLLQHPANNPRRPTSILRVSSTDAAESSKFPSSLSLPSVFGLLLHVICCLFSLLLGFRFSRVVFFLLFASPAATVLRSTTLTTTTTTLTTKTTTTTTTLTESTVLTLPAAVRPPSLTPNRTASAASHVVVGRHGIRVRPWPHPNPAETMRAHRIVELVQREQQRQYGSKSPRRVIVVTPTYVRTFQALHLTGVMHTLMLVPYDVTWIVVEAGEPTEETASIFAKSNLDVRHVPFPGGKMPVEWASRHRMEARMRLHALGLVRDQKIDGILVFADDSNVHSMELFDEIQKVEWMGALTIGILAHSSGPLNTTDAEKNSPPLPIQGPACNASGQLAGWHTFNSLPYAEKSAKVVGGSGVILPGKLEWAGFVLNSRMMWSSTEAEDKPDWVRNLDDVGKNGEEIESPLGLLKDASFVEPLGNCGKKVLLWWLRAEARSDSKFLPGWIINPSLEVDSTVTTKHA